MEDRSAADPVFEALEIGPTGRLRLVPLRDLRFVVDVNLGRPARLLRLLGEGLLKRRAVTRGLFVP